MNDVEKFRAEVEARHRTGTSGPRTRYTAALNRYLGTSGYADPYAPVPRPSAAPAPRTVVVPVDDSPAGVVVVDHAAIEADLRGGELRLVHAGVSPEGSRLLRSAAERVRARSPRVTVTSRSCVGMGPVELPLADAGRGDLVVVGRRPRAGGLMRRSVGERIAARHPGPVLVIRTPGSAPDPDRAARPLVVGVDGTGAADRGVRFAVEEAALRGCEVILLHVVREPSDVPDWTETRTGVTIHHRTVTGRPVTEILEAAAGAAALVLGYHDRGPGPARLGSIGRAVLRRATVPVFLVS